jgi:hypothetical protein
MRSQESALGNIRRPFRTARIILWMVPFLLLGAWNRWAANTDRMTQGKEHNGGGGS